MRFLKLFLSVVILWTLAASCGQEPETQSKVETGKYVAVLDSTMTISEIAKANQIGEPYLRTMLGMPDRVGAKLPLYKLKKSFRFSEETLKQIIEEAKNRD